MSRWSTRRFLRMSETDVLETDLRTWVSSVLPDGFSFPHHAHNKQNLKLFLWFNLMLILKRKKSRLPLVIVSTCLLPINTTLKCFYELPSTSPIIFWMETLKSIIHDCIIINQKQQSLSWATSWRLEAETVESKSPAAHWYARHLNLGWGLEEWEKEKT